MNWWEPNPVFIISNSLLFPKRHTFPAIVSQKESHLCDFDRVSVAHVPPGEALMYFPSLALIFFNKF